MSKPNDPLSEAINNAVKAAIAEHLAPFLNKIERVTTPAEPPPSIPAGAERFVSMTELCTRLGVNRTTILRRERAGKLPKRQAFPDGRVGWTGSVIDAWFSGARELVPDAEKNADLAARISH